MHSTIPKLVFMWQSSKRCELVTEALFPDGHDRDTVDVLRHALSLCLTEQLRAIDRRQDPLRRYFGHIPELQSAIDCERSE